MVVWSIAAAETLAGAGHEKRNLASLVTTQDEALGEMMAWMSAGGASLDKIA